MERSKDQLERIMKAYGCSDFVFDGSMKVDPDTFLYFYHKDAKQYVLLETDYLGREYMTDYPYILDYDYYENKTISIMVKGDIPITDKTYAGNTILFER